MQKKYNKKKAENLVKVAEFIDRPVAFFTGLLMLFIGLFIILGSLVHNITRVFVNETSHLVFGPWDWYAIILGSIVLLIGVALLMFSKVAKVTKSIT